MLDAKTRKDYNPFCKHRTQAPPNCTLKFLDFRPKVLDFTQVFDFSPTCDAQNVRPQPPTLKS